MSLADFAGRAPRVSFASIKAALTKQKRDLSRAHRRDAATLLPVLHRDAPRGALQAGTEPLRLLQAVLDHAEVIALDVPQRYRTTRARNVHMLVTLPAWLLDRATVIAAYDVDDEDTDGGEYWQDEEPDKDDEFSLGFPDGIIDQSRRFPGSILRDGRWQPTGEDLELDPAEREPSLAGTEGCDLDQATVVHGDMRDREEEHDAEPDERDWPHFEYGVGAKP